MNGNNWITQLFANKWIKVPVIIIIMSIAVLVLYLVGRSLLGYNVKIFGLETNPKVDTVRVNPILPAQQKSGNKDTSTLKVRTEGPSLNIKQKNSSGKNESNINTGTNNGIIGGEGNKNHIVAGDNYGINGDVTGIKQRHITQEKLNEIMSKIPRFNTLIEFGIPINDKESQNLANEIAQRLKKYGYSKFSLYYNMNAGCIDLIDFRLEGDKFDIIICPASNVSN